MTDVDQFWREADAAVAMPPAVRHSSVEAMRADMLQASGAFALVAARLDHALRTEPDNDKLAIHWGEQVIKLAGTLDQRLSIYRTYRDVQGAA